MRSSTTAKDFHRSSRSASKHYGLQTLALGLGKLK
ncbi:hypothetical protein BVRB_5g118840 [Beta vulgaris subsp. vulgaris]|nr:hypothetical protein BVRB_5g118840 [Beta vulgaris subsp. vulgaris]